MHLLTACICHGTIESKKASKPRITFFEASDDDDSEGELQNENQSVVKFADKPLKSKPRAMFTGRPKVSEVLLIHLYSAILLSSSLSTLDDNAENSVD